MPREFRFGNKCDCGESGSVPETVMPLSSAQPGRKVRVKSIAGERHVCSRMAAMGIYPGVEMELICAGCDAPCVVRVHGGTLSLGRSVSDAILVTRDIS